ncbi:MAG TPA: hypothetical protein VNN73_18495 [Blastocatellia bacterium]|nr:hypothetical protein [Blastocatellia bacterium]
MADETAPARTIEDVLELLRELRYNVAHFQESIEAFFAGNEDWQNIKSRLALFEARFASLEVKLSSASDVAWGTEEIDYMLNELTDIGKDILGMRQTFLQMVEEASQRVM